MTDEEIKNTLFLLGNNKAPRPDAFGAYFFEKAWDVVGKDVIMAFKDLFLEGKLLREVNCTSIAFIPKCDNASLCKDYRPISCCNIIYKCITKIIANRIKSALPLFIDPTQAAFVGDRRIGDNILLCQELVHNYNRATAKEKRCALKVDLMKAYDSVNWELLLQVLTNFGFPSVLVNWISKCITTPRFSVVINEELVGFFGSSRGLRQGDPLSPYLFVIAMEVLSRLLNRVAANPNFSFHWRCKKMGLTHLCFADDLMLFCKAEGTSLSLLKNALITFESWSGLSANPDKSNIFLSSVSNNEKMGLLSLIGFAEGSFPIKYLGVPLITSKLTFGDC